MSYISCCPRLFTKILKPPPSTLHRQGRISCNYIDDLYLQGQTFDQCKNVEQFDALGFTSHPNKSAFKPSQQLIILGFLIDSVKMTVALTEEKATELAQHCKAITDLPCIKIRGAMILGKITSSLPGVMFGVLYYRSIENDKTRALKINAGNFDAHITLSHDVKTELNWWARIANTIYKALSYEIPHASAHA